jgi:hypothetical protein
MQWNNLGNNLLCVSPPQSKILLRENTSNKSKTNNKHTHSSNHLRRPKNE